MKALFFVKPLFFILKHIYTQVEKSKQIFYIVKNVFKLSKVIKDVFMRMLYFKLASCAITKVHRSVIYYMGFRQSNISNICFLYVFHNHMYPKT